MNIECPQCQTPLEVEVPPSIPKPTPKPVSRHTGGLLRVFSIFLFFVGLVACAVVGIPSGLAVCLCSIGLHIVGQVELTNAYLARINEREP